MVLSVQQPIEPIQQETTTWWSIYVSWQFNIFYHINLGGRSIHRQVIRTAVELRSASCSWPGLKHTPLRPLRCIDSQPNQEQYSVSISAPCAGLLSGMERDYERTYLLFHRAAEGLPTRIDIASLPLLSSWCCRQLDLTNGPFVVHQGQLQRQRVGFWTELFRENHQASCDLA